MNNFQYGETILTTFPPRSLSASSSNCSGHCHIKIQKRLPFWIQNQPFWTYRCECCSVYQFEPGKTSQLQGGFYG